MQVIFDFIFLMETRFGTGKFRPEIRDIIRPSQFQANEMINFILARCVTCYPVLSIILVLLAIRYIAYTLRVSWLADSIFCSSLQYSARCAGRVWQPIMRHTTRCFGLHTKIWRATCGTCATRCVASDTDRTASTKS